MTLPYSEAAKKYLNDYVRVRDIADIAIYDKIRYIGMKIVDGANVYTIHKGGHVINVDMHSRRITLSTNPFFYRSFCMRVSFDKVGIYRKLSYEERMHRFLSKINDQAHQTRQIMR